jgi:hypothetical protein
MSARRRRGEQPRSPQRPIVLVFGEDENDRKAIRELIMALCPNLIGLVETRREPLVLIKNAQRNEIKGRAQRIAHVVGRERRLRNVVCVFAHEDCDDVEPAHEAVAEKIERVMAEAGCEVHAVVPAWEIEAWWFLWPEAVTACHASWSIPARYRGTEVGRIVKAKEEFRREIVSKGAANARRYRVSESPIIAKKVRELGIVRRPEAISRSYERFVSHVDKCCSQV